MDADAKKDRRRAETKDSAAALTEDLSYFREVLTKPEQSPGELRRLSGRYGGY